MTQSAQSAEGIDVSKFQAPLTVAHLSGLQFAFTKATDGPQIVDGDFSHNWAVIAQAGIHRGAYHELWNAQSAPVATQVAHFAAVVKQGGLKPGDMFGVVASDYRGVTDAEVSQFCAGLRQAVGPQHPILPYTDLDVGKTLVQTSAAWPELWIAWPSSTAPVPSQWAPAHWKTWRIWQWGSRTIGGERVDADAFNGTAAGMDAWIATYTKPPAPPAPISPPSQKAPGMLLLSIDKATIPAGTASPGLMLLFDSGKLHHVTESKGENYRAYLGAGVPHVTVTWGEYSALAAGQ